MATEIRQQDGVTIVEPSGKIVGPAVPELREVILPEIEAAEAPRILINFENVNMIDSSGLGTHYGGTGPCITKGRSYWGHQCWQTY